MTHIICALCGDWQGNMPNRGRPSGWLEFYDDAGHVAGWFWDHDCRDDTKRRIVIRPDQVGGFTRQRIRRYPEPIG